MTVLVFELRIKPLVPSLRQFMMLHRLIIRCVIVVMILNVKLGLLIPQLEVKDLKSFLVNDDRLGLPSPHRFLSGLLDLCVQLNVYLFVVCG